VLGIEAGDYRILDDGTPPHEPAPVLFEPDCFDITDATEPDFWVCEIGEDGERYCYPPEWRHTGFFEDYHDGATEALRVFWSGLKHYYPWTLEHGFVAEAPPKTTWRERGAANRAKMMRSWANMRWLERLLIVLLSPAVIFFSVCVAGGLLRWRPEGILQRLVQIVACEGAFALLAFSLLVLIYALAKPRWVLKLLEHYLLATIVFLTAISLAMVITMLVLWT
jgi:hypothetical protein